MQVLQSFFYRFKLRDLSKFIPKHKMNLYVKKINNKNKHSKKNAKKIKGYLLKKKKYISVEKIIRDIK